MKKYFFYFVNLIVLAYSISCNDPVASNEEELITTVTYSLKGPNVSGSEVVIMSFKDLDGNGGNPPVIQTTGKLKAGLQYDGIVELLDESKNPVGNITSEIVNEATEHQFFYDISGDIKDGSGLDYNDKDANNLPIGIATKVKFQQSGTGKLKITLKHQPNKSAPGVSGGNMSNAGGETDLEVTFDVVVQ